MSYNSVSDPLFICTQKLLYSLDIPPHLQGFDFLSHAIVFSSSHPRHRFLNIYTEIAAAKGISMKTVANSMTYAITRTPDKLCATLRTTRGELFISKVIASLALIIQQPPIDIPINDPLFDRVDR